MRKLVQVGEKYGELVVRSAAGVSVDGYRLFECLCSCGETTVVQGRLLVSGNTKSCGHLRGVRQENELVKKHPSEYRAWTDMIQRCENPNNKAFKKKGPKVCERWRKSFAHFLEDVGPKRNKKHVLSRWRGEKDFKPGSAGWMTWNEALAPHKRKRSKRP